MAIKGKGFRAKCTMNWINLIADCELAIPYIRSFQHQLTQAPPNISRVMSSRLKDHQERFLDCSELITWYPPNATAPVPRNTPIKFMGVNAEEACAAFALTLYKGTLELLRRKGMPTLPGEGAVGSFLIVNMVAHPETTAELIVPLERLEFPIPMRPEDWVVLRGF